MKKGLLGCLIVFVLIVVGGGYAAYRFLYLPGKAYVQGFAQLKVVPELNAQVRNQATFTPPAGNVLTTPTVERFVRTQRAIRTALGARATELQAKYQTLGERHKSSSEKPSLGEALDAFKDLAALYVDAKRAQVDALNAEGLSLAEYEWTRARVYEAAGMPVDASLQQVLNDVAAGQMPNADAVERPAETQPVPAENRKVVEPFAKELAEGVSLVFFAL